MTQPPNLGLTENASPDDVARMHRMSDSDSSTLAQHHTLGIGPSQASPGSHEHDGKDSRKFRFLEVLNRLMPGSIGIFDTRADNPTPAQLASAATAIPPGLGFALANAVRYDFKTALALGLNGLLGYDTFMTVMTFAPWGDDTGSGMYQVAYVPPSNADTQGLEIWVRYGTRAAGWKTWRKIGGSVSNIKQVIRGTIRIEGGATTKTITVPAVVPSKSDISLLGLACNAPASYNEPATTTGYITLDSATTVAAYRFASGGGAYVLDFSYQIVEYV